MLEGIMLAIGAGLMLGLYALPEKFAKDFEFENTWSLFFLLTMFVVPILASVLLIKDFSAVFNSVDTEILMKMAAASILWGTGVMMWGKAINHIGLSLGFSLFIGTVILVGSILPFFVDGLPAQSAFLTMLGGIAVVLIGVVFNGKAGLTREKDEAESKKGEEKAKGSMGTGILIAVGGGLLATGFSYANAVGRPAIEKAIADTGNAEWLTALGVMFPIFISGGIVMSLYFLWQLSAKNAWGKFKTPHFTKNFLLIFVMAFFHYAASALFAYAAFKLGENGNTVGYAIFNTACVATAIVSGIITKEWVHASTKAKNFLYLSLSCMIVGIVIVAMGNSLV